jgi:hypothetical protein
MSLCRHCMHLLFDIQISTFCPRTVFVCFVQSEQSTATPSLSSNYPLVLWYRHTIFYNDTGFNTPCNWISGYRGLNDINPTLVLRHVFGLSVIADDTQICHLSSNSTFETHHHQHVLEWLGMFPLPWSSKWSWSLHLFLGLPMFFRPFGLYCSACFGSLFVSILCTCCSHFFW